MEVPEKTEQQKLTTKVRSIRARLQRTLPSEEREAAQQALAKAEEQLSQLQQPQRPARAW